MSQVGGEPPEKPTDLRGDPGSKVVDSSLLVAVTTEHFTLQTARSSTIVESNGRVNLFLGTVSGAVVAIALVGQLSKFGQKFFVFALTLLPALIFLGGATYVRAIQNGIEDYQYARAINHIRSWYLQLHPAAEGLFLLSAEESADGVMQGVRHQRWQAFFTIAGVVGFVISILVAVTVALSAGAFGTHTYASAGIGVAVGFICELLLYRHHVTRWRQATQAVLGALTPGSGTGDYS